MNDDELSNDARLSEVGFEKPTPDARQWAMFAHLSSFVGYLIPMGNILGPLIIWMMKKEEFPLVDDQGKEALNFQISITIYALVAGAGIFCFLIGAVLLPVVMIFDIVYTIIAAIEANKGNRYRYPLTIRMVT